ncbi:sulfite exporter TauE/SafE family protein [Arenicella sp.]|nr:sulfite exporter TauE/SafE family protein [Arenicella sp.]
MIIDPIFYAAAIPAVLITGISKGGFGGIALLAVPLMSLVISPVQAAAIMLPILLAMDVSSIIAYRGKWDKRNLMILLPGAIVGIIIGALTAHLVNDNSIKLIVGTIAILFTLHFIFKGRTATAIKNPSSPLGAFLGSVSGYTSFVAHAGAPTYQLYMLPQKLDRQVYMGTSVIFFGALNAIKVVPYALLGMLALGNLSTSLVLLPLAPIGVAMGVWLNKNISNEIFYRIVYGAIFLVGVTLIWEVMTN